MDKPSFELRILGPTELIGPAPGAGEAIVRQPKRLALLSYLALTTAEGFRRRDQVIAMFWPELDQPQARTYLRKSLYGINEALGVDVFVTRGEDEVRLDSAHLWCDAVALSEQVRAGQWTEALSLHRGDLLEGLFPEGVAPEFQEWLDDQRRSLRQQAATAAWECSRLEDAVAVRAGWKAGEIRSKMFRHTYCAARIQSVDAGAPVSVFTVARELGHGGEAMVRKVYGHLGQVRHRAEVVEYRVEQHRAKLEDRLRALCGTDFGTTIGTTRLELPPNAVSRCST